MAVSADVFKRKEVKHVITSSQRDQLEQALCGKMALDAYGKSTITSIYYDTRDWQLIERSLDKPLYKEKLRVRMYGDYVDAGTPTFVEIKKKYKGIVYKRRVCMSNAAARAYFGGMGYEDACRAFPLADEEAFAKSLSTRSLQIAREIDRFRTFYGPLYPSMGIAVKRSAYAPIPEACDDFATSGLRITIDERMQYRNILGGEKRYQPLTAEDVSVLEIKALGAFPLWLVKSLEEASIRPSSFSKYGIAYETVMYGKHRKVRRPLNYSTEPAAETLPLRSQPSLLFA